MNLVQLPLDKGHYISEISGFGFAADNITDPLRIMKDSSENNSGFHVHFPVSIR